MRNVALALLLTCLPLAAPAAEPATPAEPPDSQELRIAAAQRYLATTDLRDMFDKLADEMSRKIPEAQRELFVATMKNHVRIQMFSEAMQAAMVKHFTAAELDALADFYGSPMGKSAMAKFPAYMGDLTPLITAEMQRAVSEAIKEQQAAAKAKATGT